MRFRWWHLLFLPITLPFLLIGAVIVGVVGGFQVIKMTFWPDSMG